MPGRTCDIAIVGGGLAGGLAALALARHRPEIRVCLIEGGPRIGGNHRWSWFASDLSARGTALLDGVRKTEWDDGYDVRFPEYRRQLATPYRSIASEDFAAALERELEPGALLTGREAATMDAHRVLLRDGTEIGARAVVDARGFAPTRHLRGGWQVFMGRHIRTAAPHGVARPIVMDATVPQVDGYRFVYVLPLGLHDLFLEDTYYQDTPLLDRSALSSRLDDYGRAHGWDDAQLVGFETGVLPVVTGGDLRAWQDELRIEGVARIGARGGFWNPLTSYTMPFAVETALALAQDADLPGEQLAARFEAAARRHWARTRQYRQLGSMLFGAAQPRERYRVLQRFYRLKRPLVERFYAARSTLADRVRVLAGKPPVPIRGALYALTSNRPPLLADREGVGE